MNFTADSDALLDALTTAGRARPSSSTMPILDCVLATREGLDLGLRCSNLEQHVKATCDVQFDDGSVEAAAIPYDRLRDTLQALPQVEVQLSVGPDYKVRLETPQGSYEMMGMDAEPYPDLPDVDADTEVELEGALADAVDRTAFAVSDDALRPAMMGMLLEPVGEDSNAVATDGHRMSRVELDLDLAGPNLIVPEDALSIISRLDADLLQVGDGHVAVHGAEGTLYTRTIDETFPNYESVIPDNEDTMEVDRETLLGTVQRASIYTSGVSSQIRLSVFSDHVVVDAEDVSRSSEAEETIPCEYDGDPPLQIGFNAEYMEEILSVTDAERVRFELSTPNRAAVVRPVGEEELTLLLMPVMLNDYA